MVPLSVLQNIQEPGQPGSNTIRGVPSVEDGGPVGEASRVFASGNNPQLIQPSNNISSLSPGGTYSFLNPNTNSIHQSDPLGDANVKVTEVLPLSRQMPNFNHKKVLAVQSLL